MADGLILCRLSSDGKVHPVSRNYFSNAGFAVGYPL
jgi:hypothetical protein